MKWWRLIHRLQREILNVSRNMPSALFATVLNHETYDYFAQFQKGWLDGCWRMTLDRYTHYNCFCYGPRWGLPSKGKAMIQIFICLILCLIHSLVIATSILYLLSSLRWIYPSSSHSPHNKLVMKRSETPFGMVEDFKRSWIAAPHVTWRYSRPPLYHLHHPGPKSH